MLLKYNRGKGLRYVQGWELPYNSHQHLVHWILIFLSSVEIQMYEVYSLVILRDDLFQIFSI